MNVLLAGAAGFVGRVALELLNERHQVTAFDIQNVEFNGAIVGDVLDYAAVITAMQGIDAVVNTIMKEKPVGVKGNLVKSAFITSTMGVSYKIKLNKNI